VLGLVGDASWRLGWLTVPLAAAVVAFVAVSRAGVKETGADVPPRASLREALDDPRARRWAAGELLANAAWSGTLMFVGALFAESYGTSARLTGVLLAAIAGVYVAGTFAFRRFADADARFLLVRLALSLAAGVAAFGCIRPNATVSTLVLAVTAFLAGGRVMLGNAFGLTAAPGRRAALMGVRAATTQLGYLIGATAGGLALSLGGYPGLGVVLGALFVAAAAALSWPAAAAPAASPEPA
jgi:DHA1 family inner membrane transport protein